MGAGRQRWWLDDTMFVEECLRWVLRARPQTYFRDFSGTALIAAYRVYEDPTFMPEYPRTQVEIVIPFDTRTIG